MEIVGYSERGLINSLFYEIKYSQNNLTILNNFLSLISFPYQNQEVKFQISNVKILIEQSFSDFGDADVVLLLDNQNEKQVIFIEAKVKTSQKSHWSILNEFEAFKNGQKASKVPEGFSSNLFVQLYLKVRLAKALQTGDMKQLEEGLPFPECLSKTSKRTHKKLLPRKIGDNKVVLKAIDLIKDYCKYPLFIALVPTCISTANGFDPKTLKDYKP